MSKHSSVQQVRTGANLAGALLAATLALGLLVLPGCDRGDGGGELRVFLEDEAGSGLESSGFAGELQIVVLAEVQDEFGFWTEVSNSPQQVSLPVGQSDALVEIGRRSLVPGSYTRMRLHFSEVEAHLTGAPSGFQMPSDGVVRVEFGGVREQSRVEQPATLFLDSDQDADVIFSLNSGQWLPASEDGSVPPQVFRIFVTLEIP